jgi:uncharacterized membrane protein YbjE (DUF340 family)
MVNITILYLMIPLAAGIFFGYRLRQRKHINLNRVTFAVILVLIFSLGFTIGSNNDLLMSIPAVGVSALGMAVSAIIFSVLFVVLVRRKLKI